jgi:hypothetical protein
MKSSAGAPNHPIARGSARFRLSYSGSPAITLINSTSSTNPRIAAMINAITRVATRRARSIGVSPAILRRYGMVSSSWLDQRWCGGGGAATARFNHIVVGRGERYQGASPRHAYLA